MIGLTKSVAADYVARGIRCNAICPGTIETPMVADMLAQGELNMDEAIANQPIARLGQASEIAAAVLWLCSPGASFVIGVALPIDGGYTPLAEPRPRSIMSTANPSSPRRSRPARRNALVLALLADREEQVVLEDAGALRIRCFDLGDLGARRDVRARQRIGCDSRRKPFPVHARASVRRHSARVGKQRQRPAWGWDYEQQVHTDFSGVSHGRRARFGILFE